jgi:alpha-L-fucosidase 2
LRAGFSNFRYRPFTLEGNFLGSQAVQEMLLQSWSPTPGVPDTQVIRIFPATPWRWHDAAFTDLRAEGGYRVSARREKNATTWFRVTASRDGLVRIRDNFGGRTPHWSRDDVKKAGDNFEVRLKPGETCSATLPKPAAVPPAPADAALEFTGKPVRSN